MSSPNPIVSSGAVHDIADDVVLIVGGGPVGLMTASVLAHYGVKSVIIERNSEPTKWPKMDLTNARSMELLRKIGLADSLRDLGVPSNIPYTVLMSTGLSQKSAFARWDHPSVDECQKTITLSNDGTQPIEPYLRVSQHIFETWMRELCQSNPLTDLRYDYKLETLEETSNGVECQVTKDGERHLFRAKYVVACDGASSRCRKSLGITLDGGPTPHSFLLIHFRSRDLQKLHSQGRFWHLFLLKDGAWGGAVISQDEKEIFTVHYPLPPGIDESAINPEEAVYSVLGGAYEPYKIMIDEILVRSTFRPSIAVANSFSSSGLHVFLAGDSAHQNIPTGGYGLNTGMGDAFDIGWKLAAVINGYGASGLLKSYELERKPVAFQNVHRSGVHLSVHFTAVEMAGATASLIDEDSSEGRKLRASLANHFTENDGENKNMGIEMGYRYKSPVCIPDASGIEPKWNPETYLPTTWPGSRAPHLFLKDGKSIFDHFGGAFTLVEFKGSAEDASCGSLLPEAAKTLRIPLTHVEISHEGEAAKIWERKLVLVRPDGHVAWRGSSVKRRSEAYKILETVVGYND